MGKHSARSAPPRDVAMKNHVCDPDHVHGAIIPQEPSPGVRMMTFIGACCVCRETMVKHIGPMDRNPACGPGLVVEDTRKTVLRPQQSPILIAR